MLRQVHRQYCCLLLVALGFLASAYLLYRSFVLLDRGEAGGSDICSEMFGAGCDATLMDDGSWVLGIPLAGWGVVYYVTLAAFLIMALTLRDAFSPQAMLAAMLVALAGLGNSIVLAVSIVTGTSHFCPLCMVVHAINLLLVPALFWASQKRFGELISDLVGALAYAVGRSAERPVEAAWHVLGLVTVALVALVAYQWIYVQVTVRKSPDIEQQRPDDILAEYEGQTRNEIPLQADEIVLGPEDAAVTLVVFSDFQCPHCGRLAETIAGLHKQFADQLQIVFKHYPLSNTCNSNLSREFHPQACDLAWAAEAAQRQGRFWAFHDAVFSAKKREFDDAAIEQLAKSSGLDMAQFAADWHSPEVKQSVAEDIETGQKLGVRGTPTGFLNGRRVPSLAKGSLELLIEHEFRP